MAGKNIFKKNLGVVDRTIRIALAFLTFYFMDFWNESVQLYFGILGALLILSAMQGFCLLYVPFGITTARKSEF